MHSTRRIIRRLVILAMAGLVSACAAGTHTEDPVATGGPPHPADSDPRVGITVDRFSGYSIRGGGTR